MNCACAYNNTAERNLLLLILLLLRTALAPNWQSRVHLNCACVYYNPLLLHKIDKIKITGTSHEISSAMDKKYNILLLINFIFDPTFFHITSYQILQNYGILINHESFFSEKRFPTTSSFLIFKIKFFSDWNHEKNILQNEIFINKLLNLIIIYSFSKIVNS